MNQKQRDQKYYALDGDFQTWLEKFKLAQTDVTQKQKLYAEVIERQNNQYDLENGRAPTGIH